MSKEGEIKPLIKNPYEEIIGRIGFGKYQFLILAAVGLGGMFAEGAEMAFISLLSYVFMETWNLSSSVASLHATFIFSGKLLGIIVSSLYADDIGRLVMVRLGTLSIAASYLVSPFMPEYFTFISCRFLVGFGLGVMIPVFVGYGTEVCPAKHRGSFTITLMSFFVLGELMVVGTLYLVMPDLDSDSWRFVIPIVGVPVFTSVVLIFAFLKESPLFLLKRGFISKSIETLDFLAQINKKEPLSSQEKDSLHGLMLSTHKSGMEKLPILWNEENFRKSVILVFMWMACIIVFYGFLIILPETLSFGGSASDVLLGWAIASGIQFPVQFLNGWMIDWAPLGRKGTILLSCFMLVVFEGLALLLIETGGFYVCVAGLTAFGLIVFNTLYAYTNEVYETEIRSLAVGFYNMISKFGAIGVPILIFLLNEIDVKYPFLLMGAVALVGFVLSLFLPSDKTGKPLDQLVSK